MKSQNLVFNEVDEFEDGVMESQHGTKTMEKLIGDAIDVSIPIINVLTCSKVEQNQENSQSQHKDYFVDFIGDSQFSLVNFVNLVKLTEKSCPIFFFHELLEDKQVVEVFKVSLYLAWKMSNS